LEYFPPFTNGERASVVIGQENFTSILEGPTQSIIDGPSAVAIDPQGNLWVVDDDDARVLEFAKPFTNGENASVVIGQEDFCSAVDNENNPSQSDMYLPGAMAFDHSGNLWLADSSFDRVLEFQNFNSGTSTTSTSTCFPRVLTGHSTSTTTGSLTPTTTVSTPSGGSPISLNEEFV
jgi:hypothetical protein